MRGHIFTDKERRRLKRWLETGDENGMTRKLFYQIRQNTMVLVRDVELLLKVRKELKRSGRWGRRLSSRQRSEFASRLGVSASTLKRKERST